MIHINPATAIMLYMAITLFVLLGMWVYAHYQRKKKKFFYLEKELLVCEYCQSAYMGETSAKITRCPECKSLNKENRFT